jgi:virulence protein VirJ
VTRLLPFIISLIWTTGTAASADLSAAITIRGHVQTLHLYGDRGHPPVVVASGDGGWIHLAPHVAEALAAHGFFVIGFDVKAYLESFTSARASLTATDVPADFAAVVTFAAAGSTERPILAGVSEGAGLSVLAAGDPAIKNQIAGVLCLGLPDVNELGWRWKDSVIYLTHGVPNEPTFSSAAVIAKVAPLPIAAVHSYRDEFAPIAEIERVLASAGEPKRLWIVNASDHRFSDNIQDCDRRVFDAVGWIQAHPATALASGEERQ